jgi:hypothetical protein
MFEMDQVSEEEESVEDIVEKDEKAQTNPVRYFD